MRDAPDTPESETGLARAIASVPAGSRVLLGLPWDRCSSHEPGAAAGPAAIRRSLASPRGNLWTERGENLAVPGAYFDLGDLCDLALDNAPGSDPAAGIAQVRAAADSLFRGGLKPLFLGGDHSLSFPLVQGAAATYGPLEIIHLDAHPDLYHAFEGEPLSHACPFARIMENGLAKRLVQVGVRAIAGEHSAQAQRFGVTSIPAWQPDVLRDFLEHLEFSGPVYVSLDLDVLDPAYAPGVAHPEAGGLSTRQVLDVLAAVAERAHGRLVAADLVELCPHRDVGELALQAATKLAKELLGFLA